MKILRFDSTGGASGDMVLATLVDLGADANAIAGQLRSLPLEPFDIVAAQVTRRHLRGTQVTVALKTHSHAHDRGPGEINDMIDVSGLPEPVKKQSRKVFARLAEAEAHVHGTTIDQVHFHEVGAADSIIDIVGSCLALHMLEIDSVAVGPLPLGNGQTETAHGVIPVPAPATLELLKGHAVVNTDETVELVTPTGAALLTTWNEPDTPRQSSIVRVGCGIGHRELAGRPNLLRATLEESDGAAEVGGCLVLECNLDDTVPELLGSLTRKLLEQGALDVFTTPIQMKKQRPGALLTVLAVPGDKAAFLDLIFRESTTFGVREYVASRTCLPRRHIVVETPYGEVRVKIGVWNGDDVTRAPEHDDCVKCAEQAGVSVRSVYEAALRAVPGN